jgi:L-lysine 2,3-aminomutase
MITASIPTRQRGPSRWQADMASAITQPLELVTELGLDPALVGPAVAAGTAFRLRVPRSYVSRIRHGDPNDPLLRQILPIGAELADTAEYTADPLGEHAALRAPGLLQKYKGRALLITTSACAVHCRYCFRREYPYASTRLTEALEKIARDSSIEEVILSGGDPLSLSDSRLASLTDELQRIPHVRRLRVHTRQPVVLPSRVDAGLTEWLTQLRLPVVFVLHVNHGNEIDAEVRAACGMLRDSGVTLLNQTVLLRGINDDAGVLADLSRALFEAGVLPYYLHVLDHVRGAAHFDVPEERARLIAGQLAAQMPGYLVPRLAREIYGAPAKVTLAPTFT